MLFSMAMSAQMLSNGDLTFQHAPYALKNFTGHKGTNTRMMAPMRADLGENQIILGHYDTDDVVTGGYLGLTNFAGVIPTAIEITPDELAMFQGGKIVAFRVGLAQATTISRVFVAPVTNDGTIGTFTEWNCNSNSEGWNEIPIDPPYEINLDSNTSLFIGYDYRQTSSNYPISAVQVGTLYPTYMYLTYQGQTGWYDLGLDSYGNLSLQCIVESDNFPDYMIGLNDLYVPTYTRMGDDLYYIFATRNNGVAESIEPGACTYDILIDGNYVTTVSNTETVTREYSDIYGYVPSDALTPGMHTLTITVNSLFGEPVDNPASISKTFYIYEFGFNRQMHLIEEFTSNSCMYCPLGLNMLKVLYNMRDDIALVAIHGNQSTTDPCNTAQCDTIQNYVGLTGWPSAAFDRSVGWEDDETIAPSIGYYEQYHQEIARELSSFLDNIAEAPSFATININSKIDAETNVATITIDGQVTPDFVSMMGQDAKLTVYLTEDSIIYRQNNNGTWVQKYQHDHVMRVALGSVFGNALNITGETFKNEFTYTLPSSWKTDKMEVVAFISRPLANGASGDYTDMYVNQANKRKLGEFDEPTIMRGDVNQDGSVNIADVTELIDILLGGFEAPAEADCNLDQNVNIADVTALIDYLLSGVWAD